MAMTKSIRRAILSLALILTSTVCMANPVAIIPVPNKMTVNSGSLRLCKTSTIGIDDEALRPAANYLAEAIEKEYAMRLSVVSGDATINLRIASTDSAYHITTDKHKATLCASDYGGIINAIATLRQLMTKEGNKIAVACVDIIDKPRFGWRGLMIDCSRHFYTTDELKHLLDVMAFYKFNRFHWHLTDDQGWRVEIKRYPLLTSRGAWRKLNRQDSTCIRRANEEDMPNLRLQESKLRNAADGTMEYGGFYTQDDVRDVVAYAKQRGIDVVPEIDMPGHSLAAIESYSGLSCFAQNGWGKLFTTPMCPGKDSMLEFCRNVWEEMFQLFPFEYVHIGGDEVDMKNWKACPDCQKRMKANGLSTEPQLQTWFNHTMEAFFREHGKKMIAWDDVVDGGLSPYTTVMWWRSWLPDGPKKTTDHGNDLIDVPVSYFYLSQEYKPTLLPGIYSFNPYDGIKEDKHNLMRGIHSCLWGESVASADRMWYKLFPSLLAVAEKAWSSPETMNYSDFYNRMVAQLPRLESMGVKYRLPDLIGLNRRNVFFDRDTVSVSCIDPSVTIHYTTDGSAPQLSSPVYNGRLIVSQTTHFQFRAFGSDGRKGDIFRSDYIKGSMSQAVVPSGELHEGLHAVWYDYGGTTCKDIETAPLKGTYTTDGVEIPREAVGNIGLVLTGYISVPQDGIYTFRLYSNDGAQLSVDGNVVADNDGMHDAVEITCQHAMQRGLHPISVRFFDHNGPGLQLRVFDKHAKEMPVGYLH